MAIERPATPYCSPSGKLFLDEYSGSELRINLKYVRGYVARYLNGGEPAYHSMIYLGKCCDTHECLVADHDKGRRPMVRLLSDIVPKSKWKKLRHGMFPKKHKKTPKDVVKSAINEVYLKQYKPSDYDFISNNCQNFSSRHIRGKNKSPQIEKAKERAVTMSRFAVFTAAAGTVLYSAKLHSERA